MHTQVNEAKEEFLDPCRARTPRACRCKTFEELPDTLTEITETSFQHQATLDASNRVRLPDQPPLVSTALHAAARVSMEMITR